MKIILSRKGFDSGYGGYPSPILPDGRLISFPIPSRHAAIKYKDLKIEEGISYSNLISDLIGNELKLEGRGNIPSQNAGCHLDPDICESAYTRKEGWKGMLGQVGSAQSHLSNKKVSKGDIFLFFGWFRSVARRDGKYTYDKQDRNGKHIIYGYLQIDDILRVKDLMPSDWMEYHPHVERAYGARENDHIYVASERLSINPSLKGYGMFEYDDRLKLTKDGYSRSRWQLPDFFKETSISYHSEKSWKEEYFQSAAKGQEFVIESTNEIDLWVKKLIETCGRCEFNVA